MSEIKCPKCEGLLVIKGTMETVEIPSFETITREKLNCKKCRKNYAGEPLIKISEIDEYLTKKNKGE